MHTSAYYGAMISVLVVEDQADIRSQVQGLLERAGYEVHTADGTDQAIDLLNRLPRPCILLWDPMTPRRSLTMVNRATLEGVHVAALPVSMSAVHLAGSSPALTKRLTSEDAILNIVQEYCPPSKQAIA